MRRPSLRWMAALWTLPFLVVVVLFDLLPMVSVVAGSLFDNGNWSLANFGTILASRFYRGAFETSIWLSLLTSAIGLVIGFPLSLALYRRSIGVQRRFLTLFNVASNFVGVPLALAFTILGGVNGVVTLLLVRSGLVADFNVYSLQGLALVYSYFQIPFTVLVLFPSLGVLTPDLAEAAALMGTSRWAYWWRIGLPILLPSLAGTFILLFANAMGTYATAYALIGGGANLVTIRIGELVGGDVFTDPGLANALAVLLVVTLLVPILADQLLLKRTRAR
jgi:putative spermidine/putrescine transport system permease protein